MTSMNSSFLGLLAGLFGMAAFTQGAVIDFYGGFQSGSGSAQAPGQSVTTPTGGPWSNITFNWYDSTTGAPLAQGNLYLLSQAYTGTPQALSLFTPNLLGVGAASAGVYAFAPSLSLAPSTQYFFYSDSVPGGQGAVEMGAGAGYAGGVRYGAANGNGSFTSRPGDVSFSLQGVAVPEPGATSIVAALGLASLFVTRRHICKIK